MRRRAYPAEFRRRVLDLVEGGRRVADIAEDVGISDQSLRSEQFLQEDGRQPCALVPGRPGHAGTSWSQRMPTERLRPNCHLSDSDHHGAPESNTPTHTAGARDSPLCPRHWDHRHLAHEQSGAAPARAPTLPACSRENAPTATRDDTQ